MFSPSDLWKAPDVNPINQKARAIPILNPLNVYGRVFNFAWFGFFVAFWSWYAFPPLLTITIAKDVGLSKTDIANSNIVALLGTLVARLAAGPACDRFGPRYTFVAVLLAGSIPTALAGAVTNTNGLIALRFFVGILGASFVPCQVWSTGFFDQNVVGTSNALIGGWGNAGGGITYFLMPAIFDYLTANSHMATNVAWRVAFVVPFIVIVVTAFSMLLLCPDTPTGKWSDRHLHTQQNLAARDANLSIVNQLSEPTGGVPSSSLSSDVEKVGGLAKLTEVDTRHMIQLGEQQIIDIAEGEIIQKPSIKEAGSVFFSLPTLTLMACYSCSFGAELAINSSLGTYYLANFPSYGQTGTGRWAAMFGLLNIISRPLGGMVSDLLYRRTKSLWVKKILIQTLGVITGAFLIAIGVKNSHNPSTMFGLVAGMAMFLEAGNGANFSLVPHVHPYANGIVSGCTGASGNLGGIIFAIIFRYMGTDYGRAFWIIGIMNIATNLAVSWIRPIPKSQVVSH